jgi:drug/metabolite transporter (DMT)-like permease
MRTVVWSALAMVAFAANSLLCRMALLEPSIDPAEKAPGGSLASAGLLALYAVPFSFAYTRLTTGTGALILFACVQLTMLMATMRAGEQIRTTQWTGAIVAFAGLVYLVLPTLATPALTPAALMACAGIAWGAYSWRGRGAADPLGATTRNFLFAMPFVFVVSVLSLPQLRIQTRGVALAVASGAVASGLGYVVWYTALRRLTGTQAAVLQLSVPVIAAAAGVVVLAEVMSLRLVVSAVLVLGGIALAISGKR